MMKSGKWGNTGSYLIHRITFKQNKLERKDSLFQSFHVTYEKKKSGVERSSNLLRFRQVELGLKHI